jgi:hypothetical protein
VLCARFAPLTFFKELPDLIENRTTPPGLSGGYDLPARAAPAGTLEIDANLQEQLIVEYYSR